MTDSKWHKEIELPDGTITDNYSQVYQRYCEALNLSKKNLYYRREWLEKIKDSKRVEELKYWLQLIWKTKEQNL